LPDRQITTNTPTKVPIYFLCFCKTFFMLLFHYAKLMIFIRLNTFTQQFVDNNFA